MQWAITLITILFRSGEEEDSDRYGAIFDGDDNKIIQESKMEDVMGHPGGISLYWGVLN